jgi:hypothetical protein
LILMRRGLFSAIALLIAAPAFALAQTGQTATLTGTIVDAGGAALPGAAVTVTSESLIGGSRTAQSTANGIYRFPALPPGLYRVTIAQAGFKTSTRDVRLFAGLTTAVDVTLEPGASGEPVPIVELDDRPFFEIAGTQTTIGSYALDAVPFESRFGMAAMLLAPGVNPNNYSAYGSGGESSNMYSLDGANVGDPETGATWVFANYHWIQEMQVIGGANAEYGGFTGVASNIVLRSGSNMRHGLFETLFQNDGLRSSNVTDETLLANAQLAPASTDYVTDTTIQLGGPIRRDKLWFFAGAQYYRSKTAPAGFPSQTRPGYTARSGAQAHMESAPRFLFKPTYRRSDSSTIDAFIEADTYSADGYGAAANVAPDATLRQESPELAWNGAYMKVLSPASALVASYSGFRGAYKLSPYNGDVPGWYDADEDYYAVNAFYRYKADRMRDEVKAHFTRYTSAFGGEHALKTGAEFERSGAKSAYGYNGGMFVEASFGQPYFAYLYEGYAKDDAITRVSVFAQDSWAAGSHVTISPGVRFDRITGSNKHLGRQVLATNSIAPRLGLAWDMGGKGRHVFRADYGWYYDAARTGYFDLIDPQINPIYGVDVDSRLNPTSNVFVETPGQSHAIADTIKQPRMQQATIGLEQQLFGGLSVSATGIYRRNDRFIDDVLQFAAGDFTTLVVADPGPDGAPGTTDDTRQAVTLQRQRTNALANQYLITNPSGAFREYQGLAIAATRRTRGRWALQASWVLSKTTGNYDNISNAGNDAAEYNDPNTDPRYQPLREGRLTYDATHLAKALGTYRGPWNVWMSGAFYYTTGDAFTRTIRTTRTQTPQGRKDVFIEPRGSGRYDDQLRLDARIEKRFTLRGGALGVSVEGFNIMNDAAVTAMTTRSGLFYGTPQAIVAPRRLRVGATYRF